jgi:hypothetical protein
MDYVTVITNPVMGIAAAGPYQATGARMDANPFNQYISVTVNNSCYEIQCVVLDGNLLAGTYEPDIPVGPTWNGTILVATPNCNRKLEVFLRKVTYSLTMEMIGLKGTILDIGNEKIVNSPEGRETRAWQRHDGKARYLKIVEYACGEVVTLTPEMKKNRQYQ